MGIVETLAALSQPDHTPTLPELRALSDLPAEEHANFWAAWQALGTARRREIIGRLSELADDNVDLNFGAVLFAALDDADSAVRARAIEGLWGDEHPRTLRRLLALLRDDPQPEVRAAAAVTLGRFAYLCEMGELNSSDDQTLRAELLRVLNDPEQTTVVRRRALEAAGYFGSLPAVQQAIRSAYATPEAGMRESALVAMGRSLDDEWLGVIAESLASPEAALRYQAARAAGEFSEDGAPLLRPLLPLLDDDDSEVVLAAIWALGQIGGPRAKETLERLRKRGDEAQRQAADAALQELALGDDPMAL